MGKQKSGRGDRLPEKGTKDPYKLREKPPGAAVCPGCQAAVKEGRWTWDPPRPESEKITCPACRRIEDDYPAGYLTLAGDFFRQNRDEIMNLLANVAEAERGERPLERIMNVRRGQTVTEVTTTGVHIARRLGDALKRSYQGELSVHYVEGEKTVRVNWKR